MGGRTGAILRTTVQKVWINEPGIHGRDIRNRIDELDELLYRTGANRAAIQFFISP